MNATPPVFLRARWSTLLMANYPVDPAVLAPLVPRGTELDTFQGRAYCSMVGFRFLDTRVLGCRIPFHVNFDEVNLRFYIKRRRGEGWIRAVAFVKEIVPRWAIATVARTLYNEPYVALPMQSEVRLPTPEAPEGLASYRWKYRGRECVLAARMHGSPESLPPESEAAYITEHYWGYTRQRDGSTVEYQVEHPAWRVWSASDLRFECDVAALYGEAFVPALSAAPTSVFVAEGSDVLVRRGVRLPDSLN